MNTENLVRLALKDKAPGLLRELTASGKLGEFLADRADQMREATVTLSMDLAENKGYSKTLETDPMKAVGILKEAKALARERVHAEMLEFPQDETSQSSPGETMSSAPTI